MLLPDQERIPEREIGRKIDGQVPFVEQLISQLPDGISQTLEMELEKRSRAHNLSYLATQITRIIDRSGLVPNIVDACESKNDAEDILLQLAATKLADINALGEKKHYDILQTLQDGSCTPNALVTLDRMFGEMIGVLKLLRGSKSEQLRTINQELIDKKQVQILYYPSFIEGKLDYINHSFLIPPSPPQMTDLLVHITPDFLNRQTAREYPVDTPEGFLQTIGIVGDPFTRELAQYTKVLLNLRSVEQEQRAAMMAFDEYIRNNP